MRRLKRTTQRILLHAMTMLTKLTWALKVTFCDESCGETLLSNSHKDTCRFLPCQLWTQTKFSSMTFLACSKMRCFFQMLVNFVIPDFTITCDVCYFRGDGFRSFEVHLIVSHAVIKASPKSIVLLAG